MKKTTPPTSYEDAKRLLAAVAPLTHTGGVVRARHPDTGEMVNVMAFLLDGQLKPFALVDIARAAEYEPADVGYFPAFRHELQVDATAPESFRDNAVFISRAVSTVSKDDPEGIR